MSSMNYIAILPLRPRKRTFPSSQKAHCVSLQSAPPSGPTKAISVLIPITVVQFYLSSNSTQWNRRVCTLCLATLGQHAFERHPSCLHQKSVFLNCLSFHYLNIMCMSIHLLRTFGLSFGSLDKAAMHILVLAFLETSVFSSLGKCLGVELLGWRIGIGLT